MRIDKIVNWKSNKSGITLISLIITIIVMIIISVITIYSGLHTPDRANLAKFVSEFSDFHLAITQDYMQKIADYALSGKTRTEAQIYYAIAKGSDYSGDINEKPKADGKVENLGVTIYPDNLTGTDFYLITDDTNVMNWQGNKKYYQERTPVNGEQHFITDKGEPFIIPGYRVEEEGITKWFINENQYYIREEQIQVAAILDFN